ncbi:MAG TPA: LytTR family DNA-binding domain-containing protein [Bacteroidia bacterium]|nr:LytTR family DNA-binding domain-containing protein [Bacteroidia bacterium]
MIKAVAIDDEPIALKVIENFCSELDFITLEKSFSNSREGLKYLNKFPVDLVFLDIDMPFLNGMDLYRQLKQDTLVIFITSKAEYAVEGFNLMAVDYLLKPFTRERFLQAAGRARDLLNLSRQSHSQDERFLYIRADFSLIKVSLADIMYIEALDDYLKIHIEDQKTLVARMTMKTMMEKLPAGKFMRVHRSFIVAKDRVQAVRSKSLMVDRLEIPMGGSYIEEVQKQFGK